MTIHAYDSLYLNKSTRMVGNMLHDAVSEFGMDGSDFLNRFIQSGVAQQIENGSPDYLAGKSGFELYLEVMDKSTGKRPDAEPMESYDRSAEYWVGWLLTHYQWHSGKSFKNILDIIPYNEFLRLYGTLHEADIQKSYDVLDAHFEHSESRLKTIRKYCGLTQEALADKSGVSLNTIRAYERKSKNINKAQYEIVQRLAQALKCEVSELME